MQVFSWWEKQTPKHKTTKTLHNYFVNINNSNKQYAKYWHYRMFYFKNYTSIKTIKKIYDESNEKCSFQPVSFEDIAKVVKSLDIKKVLSVKAHSNTPPFSN